ncbi:MAG TPA: metalloregulator ArsR/SmtB family transcription factor [Chitinophagaceae bacterium]
MIELAGETSTTARGAASLAIELLPLKKAATVLRAVNHNLRQDMLKLLHAHGRLSVSELYHRMNLEQSVASQHLAILRKAGVVMTEREGKQIFYSVNHKRLKEVQQKAAELLYQ